jgi:hypothetical protein
MTPIAPASAPFKLGSDAHDLALAAVGRGIRHSFVLNTPESIKSADTQANCVPTISLSNSQSTQNDLTNNSLNQPQQTTENNLLQLASNFRNSLMQSVDCSNDLLTDADPTPWSEMHTPPEPIASSDVNYFYRGCLSQNSSLVDLAMIVPVEDSKVSQATTSDNNESFEFIDFQSLDMFPDPSSSQSSDKVEGPS